MITFHICNLIFIYVIFFKICSIVGHDTKAMLNNSGPRYKHSKVERDINLDIIACVVILFTICFLCGVGKYPCTKSYYIWFDMMLEMFTCCYH